MVTPTKLADEIMARLEQYGPLTSAELAEKMAADGVSRANRPHSTRAVVSQLHARGLLRRKAGGKWALVATFRRDEGGEWQMVGPARVKAGFDRLGVQLAQLNRAKLRAERLADRVADYLKAVLPPEVASRIVTRTGNLAGL